MIEPEEKQYIRPQDLDNEQRTTLGAKIGWSIEAFLWDWAFWKPMQAMSPEAASNAISGILRKLGPLGAPHRTMTRNLRMAFPTWSEKEVAEVADGVWDTLGRLAGEMPHLARMKPYLPDSRVEVAGTEHLDRIRETGKPAVFISGHLANWELLSPAICLRPVECLITYRAANNPYIDRRIAQARHDSGIPALAPKGAGTRDLMRALGKGVSVALMNDQKFNQGIAVPFFGHDAMTAPGPTRLAMRYKAPLLPASCVRLGPARYRVTFHEPFMPETGPDENAAIHATVLKINQFMEHHIRANPAQWFWMHNRWPKEAWVKAGVM